MPNPVTDPARIAASIAGRYTIDREIGRGGMATVYLARDIKHSRPVALKILDPDLGAVLGVERFLAEIRVTANLQHPNLLPLFDSGEINGTLFYVMPYVEVKACATGSRAKSNCPSPMPSTSRPRSRARWTTRTAMASSIAISSRRTFSCTRASPSSLTLESH
jgi:serine/threonine protein kinase